MRFLPAFFLNFWNWFTTPFFLAFAALAWISYDISRYESLSWMRGNTPDTGVDYYALYPEDYTYPESAYSVMSWWDYGHWITRIAHRIPVANNFQQGIGGPHQENTSGACVFFIAKNESEANKISDALNVRYAVSDFLMADAMSERLQK